MAARVMGGARAVRVDKASRQRRIVEILRVREIDSQAELARVLAAGGDDVTQATLSRDLEDLGAYKARGGGGSVIYRVPDEPPAAGAWLERMLREFAVEIGASANLCVVKTPPGGANALARAIDNAAPRDVLGTIAGDDTIMIVAAEGSTGTAVARRLRAIAGLPASAPAARRPPRRTTKLGSKGEIAR